MPTTRKKTTTTRKRTSTAVTGINTPPATIDSSKQKKKVLNIASYFEKAPLFLTVMYQSYIVGLWSYYTLSSSQKVQGMDIFHAIFSIFAGLSLDLVMIGTALRDDQKGPIHFLTLFGAWFASSAISYSFFDGDWLHITWSTMVFLFSWSLAEGKGTDLTKSLREYLPKKKTT